MNKMLVFSAEWCGPCKALKPTLLQLDQDRIVYYDIDRNIEERELYQIRAVPTIILLDSEGIELDRLMGSQSLRKLQDLLDRE
jgi:thioredoxin 1